MVGDPYRSITSTTNSVYRDQLACNQFSIFEGVSSLLMSEQTYGNKKQYTKLLPAELA